MYSGKLSKDDRRLRREKLILYIRDNGPVSSAQLCSALGMSRGMPNIRLLSSGMMKPTARP